MATKDFGVLSEFIVEVKQGITLYTPELNTIFKRLIAQFQGLDYKDGFPNSLKQTAESYDTLTGKINDWNKASGVVKNSYLRNLCFPSKSDPTHPKEINRLILVYNFFEDYFKNEKKTAEAFVSEVRKEFAENKKKIEDIPFETVAKTHFSVVGVPLCQSDSAERFYNGFPISYEDLKAGFDFQRSVYIKQKGIKTHINDHFLNNRCTIILIKGVAGSGKSSLIKRIGYDIAENQNTVYELKNNWLDDEKETNLQTQILSLIDKKDNVVFLIDGIAKCLFKNELNLKSLFEKCQDKKVLFILTEQPYNWNKIKGKLHDVTDSTSFIPFSLWPLDETECSLLVDKLFNLEESNKLSTLRNANLTRSQRLSICINSSKRHLIVVMMQTRYGKKFSETIINEFENIPSDSAKEAYLCICFWNRWQLPLPESVFVQILNANESLDIKEIILGTEGLITFSPKGVSARHILIAREVYRVFFDHKIQKYAFLKNAFLIMNPTDFDTKRFIKSFLSKEELYKLLVRELEKDAEIIHSILDIIKSKAFTYDNDIKISFLTFYALIERFLNIDDVAKAIYLKITNDFDPEHSFSYRQLAWIEQENQNFKMAIEYAKKSYDLSENNAWQVLQVARIYSLNTIENFKKADYYYKQSILKSDNEQKIIDEYERYLSSLKMLNYITNLDDRNLIPNEVIISLRPSKKFIQMCFGINSRQFKNKILNTLHGMEADTTGSIDELEEVVEGYNVEKDKLIKSKYYSNLARLTYLQWYQTNAATDIRNLSEIFEESIRLNFNDPFTHCWFGTYLKEVKNDFVNAKLEYRRAIDLSETATHNFDHHPIFSNNMALLLIDEVILRRVHPTTLFEAEKLLIKAADLNKEKQIDFLWPEENLIRCRELIDTYINIDK